jgi:hypothetical protein
MTSLPAAHDRPKAAPVTAPQPTAQEWICDDCGVTASRLDGQPAIEPSCWTNSEEGRLCLACRRSRASEAALDRAPTGISRDDYRQIRRTGLIEFEVRRSPSHRDGRIASACGTTPLTVAAVRRKLEVAARAGR